MSFPYFRPESQQILIPRVQARRLAEQIQGGPPIRAVLAGRRGEGKSDLLAQIHTLLFENPDGPIPFLHAFRRESLGAASRRFVSGFCRQARAFLGRRQEWLWQPAGCLESSDETFLLPSPLSELARDFLALPEAEQWEKALSLPVRFASLARQPICLLLDDIHECGPESGGGYWPADSFDAPEVSCLIAGRRPFARSLVGEISWPLTALEPFSSQEALQLAEKSCQKARIPFHSETWSAWFCGAGTSPLLAGFLVKSAALSEQALDSPEQLGRVYADELASGALGNWLAVRFARAVPHLQQRAAVCEFIRSATGGAPPSPASLPPQSWNGLVAEEWAEMAADGPIIQLDRVQQDWIALATARWDALGEQVPSLVLSIPLRRIERRGFAAPQPGVPSAEGGSREGQQKGAIQALQMRLARQEQELLQIKAALAESSARETELRQRLEERSRDIGSFLEARERAQAVLQELIEMLPEQAAAAAPGE